MELKWKPDWSQAKSNLTNWWNHKGLALCIFAPRKTPVENIPQPVKPSDVTAAWTDPVYRCSNAEWNMSRTLFAGEAFPYFDTQIGPGSLGIFIGATPGFAPETVWYEPCIDRPDSFHGIHFSPKNNRWLDVHVALVDEGLRRAGGRYLVGMPDLIENIDTLAALRGTEPLLMDLIERPKWIHARLAEINKAFFASFGLIYDKIKADGGNAFAAFRIWGPGRTAKVQCDFSCMISPAMFKEFVAPSLTAQCKWLDYSMYHLDGTTALQHLDALLAIEPLDAIEWTPQAGLAGGGSPQWYDLYKRIKAAGKSVQAIGVKPEEVVPLVKAVGPEGLFVMCNAESETAAKELIDQARSVG